MKVFLDTNVLASALATRGLCAELFEVVLQSHDLIVSQAVIAELERVLPEKLGMSRRITREFVTLVLEHARLAKAEGPEIELPDPDDVPIVSAAIGAGAEVFVTGDSALLKVESAHGLPLVSPRRFWEILSGR